MRAAEYIRMSTDFQQYSTTNQQAHIREFASARGFTVVRTYLDEGKSGLRLKGRPALQSLLSDVMHGTKEFDAILVYDVSRWGRFQDLDEGAHYEFLCRSAGKRVVYCAELFEQDASPYGAIVKGLRRIMAGEYSRELSEKVFTGQSRLAREGYHVGAATGLGFRRLLLDRDGNPKGILGYKQHKALQDDHVILVPGPAEEIKTVREIFNWFVHDRLLYAEIARRLNRAGIRPPPHLKAWTKAVIRRMISDEKYIGHNVYNKTTGRFRQTRKKNPELEWVRCENAFAPIVEPSVFAAARARAKSNLIQIDPARAESRLKALLEKRGRLSVSLMKQAKLPDPTVYARQFGSLVDAFHWAGYDAPVDYERISTQAWASRRHRQLFVRRLIRSFAEEGEKVVLEGEYVLVLRGSFRVAVTMFRYVRKGWRADQPKPVHATLCVRAGPFTADDEFFLVPQSASRGTTVWATRANFEPRFGPFRHGQDQLTVALIELARTASSQQT